MKGWGVEGWRESSLSEWRARVTVAASVGGCVKEVMVGGPGERASTSPQRREGKGTEQGVHFSSGSCRAYFANIFHHCPYCPIFAPVPQPWSSASLWLTLDPWWLRKCSHAYYESAKWELEQGLNDTVLEKLLELDLSCS